MSAGWQLSSLLGRAFSNFSLSPPINDVQESPVSSPLSYHTWNCTPQMFMVFIRFWNIDPSKILKATWQVRWWWRLCCLWCCCLSYATDVLIKASISTSVTRSIKWSSSGMTWFSVTFSNGFLSLQYSPLPIRSLSSQNLIKGSLDGSVIVISCLQINN